MNTRNILSGARLRATIIILSGWLTFVGAAAALGGGLDQPVITNQQILPPYDGVYGSQATLGLASGTWSANEDSGAIVVLACAWAGSATAEAMQYIDYNSPIDGEVTVIAEMVYVGGTFTPGIAAWAGTEATWRVGGDYYRQDIDPAFGFDDVTWKIFDLATICLGSAATGGKTISEVIGMIQLIHDYAKLAKALNDLRQAGDAETIVTSCTFDVYQGSSYRIHVGLSATTSDVGSQGGFALMLGQVSSIRILQNCNCVTICGNVKRSTDGRQIRDALVSVRVEPVGVEPVPGDMVVDGNGTYAAVFYGEGTYSLTAAKEGYDPNFWSQYLPMGSTITHDFFLNPNTPGTITGDVSFSGFPVSDANVEARSGVDTYSVKTFAGHYDLLGVKAGTYDVTVSRDGCDGQTKTGVVVDPDTLNYPALTIANFDLVAHPRKISGRVVIENTSTAIEGASVSTQIGNKFYTAWTDSSGGYEIEIPPTTHVVIDITAAKDGFYPSTVSMQIFPEPGDISTVDFELERPPPLYRATGHVFTKYPYEQPVGGAVVTLRNQIDGTYFYISTTTDASGNFSFYINVVDDPMEIDDVNDFLLGYSYSMKISRTGYSDGWPTLKVTTPVQGVINLGDIELIPKATFSLGYVDISTYINGIYREIPLPGATVEFSWAGVITETTTDSNGYYELYAPIERDGSYPVTAYKKGFSRDEKLLSLTPGEFNPPPLPPSWLPHFRLTPRAVITSISPSQYGFSNANSLSIEGATLSNEDGFSSYEVFFGPGTSPGLLWEKIYEGTSPVSFSGPRATDVGLLATWDTIGVPDGVYTIRLRVKKPYTPLPNPDPKARPESPYYEFTVLSPTLDRTPPSVWWRQPGGPFDAVEAGSTILSGGSEPEPEPLEQCELVDELFGGFWDENFDQGWLSYGSGASPTSWRPLGAPRNKPYPYPGAPANDGSVMKIMAAPNCLFPDHYNFTSFFGGPKSETGMSPGTYTFRLKAVDFAGNESTADRTIVLPDKDNRPNIPSTPSGPTSGTVGTSYMYSTSTTDPDGDKVKYTFDWGDGQTTTTALINSGITATLSHSWSAAKTYLVKVKAIDSRGAESDWSSSLSVNISLPNRPPNKPSTPSGPTSGTVGPVQYTYITSATDPDGDQVFYIFDWDDGTPQTRTPFSGFVNSGTPAGTSHAWTQAGTYLVKAKATDSKGALSGWSDALTVNVSAAVGQTLVDVPGLGGIRKGPSANVLTIYSSGQYIEWTLWYGNTYQQGGVAANATGNVTIPHYASFILSISRPAVGKIAWLFGRENDGQLAYTTLTGTTQANTLVDVAGFGGIRKGPSPNVLTIYSSGQVVEWTLWYGSTYQTDYIAAGNTRNVTIPHYASFILTIARPGAGKTSWLFARENDSQLAYTTLTGTTVAHTLVDVPGLGGIRKGPSANVLTIYSSGQYIEWTLWYGNTYQQGGVAANATGNVTIPHYASFILSISRPAVGKTAWMFARENDNQLAYAVIESP